MNSSWFIKSDLKAAKPLSVDSLVAGSLFPIKDGVATALRRGPERVRRVIPFLSDTGTLRGQRFERVRSDLWDC